MDADPADRGLRTTFDDVAEQYDRARPTYPAPLLDDLVELAAPRPGARVVEIGCGTGQATRSLAERGLHVTCVDLGARLAELARRNLAAFPAVQVVNEPFETWEPAEAAFDAVVAFTSFHWIDPALRYHAAARLLRPGGRLAVVTTQHVLPDDADPFFAAAQADYAAVLPEEARTTGGPPPAPGAVVGLGEEIEASGLFTSVAVRRHLWDVTLTGEGFTDLLGTFSAHRALDEVTRRRLFARLRRRVEARPGGTVRKTYLATLDVAERR